MSDQLMKIVEDIRVNGPWTITRQGRPAAVIVDYDELAELRRKLADLEAALGARSARRAAE